MAIPLSKRSRSPCFAGAAIGVYCPARSGGRFAAYQTVASGRRADWSRLFWYRDGRPRLLSRHECRRLPGRPAGCDGRRPGDAVWSWHICRPLTRASAGHEGPGRHGKDHRARDAGCVSLADHWRTGDRCCPASDPPQPGQERRNRLVAVTARRPQISRGVRTGGHPGHIQPEGAIPLCRR